MTDKLARAGNHVAARRRSETLNDVDITFHRTDDVAEPDIRCSAGKTQSTGASAFSIPSNKYLRADHFKGGGSKALRQHGRDKNEATDQRPDPEGQVCRDHREDQKCTEQSHGASVGQTGEQRFPQSSPTPAKANGEEQSVRQS